MILKKALKSQKGQSTLEYLGVAIMTAAALISIALLPRITAAFQGTVDTVISTGFQAQILEE